MTEKKEKCPCNWQSHINFAFVYFVIILSFIIMYFWYYVIYNFYFNTLKFDPNSTVHMLILAIILTIILFIILLSVKDSETLKCGLTGVSKDYFQK
jgi:hypothetical protein